MLGAGFWPAGKAGWRGLTLTLSIQASILSCSTAFLACEMLVVLLLDMTSFILLPLKQAKLTGWKRLTLLAVLPSPTAYSFSVPAGEHW